MDGLEQQIEDMKRLYPDKYRKQQSIGDSYMGLPYNVESGQDREGDIFVARKLLSTIRDYGFSESDLTRDELDLLTRVYGSEWRQQENPVPVSTKIETTERYLRGLFGDQYESVCRRLSLYLAESLKTRVKTCIWGRAMCGKSVFIRLLHQCGIPHECLVESCMPIDGYLNVEITGKYTDCRVECVEQLKRVLNL
jgi:hypothetical protein